MRVYFTTWSKQTYDFARWTVWTIEQSNPVRYIYSVCSLSLLHSPLYPIDCLPLPTTLKLRSATFNSTPSTSQSVAVHLNYCQFVRLERGQCSHIASFLPGSCPKTNLFPNTWWQSIQAGARFHAGYQAKLERCVAGKRDQSNDLISMRDAIELFSSLEGWRHTSTLVCIHLSRWLSGTWPISMWVWGCIEGRCSDGFQHRTSLRVRGAIQHM